MPVPPKPTPKHFCAQCGTVLERKRYPSGTLEDLGAFTRRKYCNRQCMAAGQEGVMKTPTAKSGRRQAQKSALGSCEVCGRSDTRLSVHHKDEDPLNNAPENLQTLCGSCHRRTHSPNYMGTPTQPKACAHCSKPVARQGLCNTHLTRLKRYGDPLAMKVKIGSSWVLKREDGSER